MCGVSICVLVCVVGCIHVYVFVYFAHTHTAYLHSFKKNLTRRRKVSPKPTRLTSGWCPIVSDLIPLYYKLNIEDESTLIVTSRRGINVS